MWLPSLKPFLAIIGQWFLWDKSRILQPNRFAILFQEINIKVCAIVQRGPCPVAIRFVGGCVVSDTGISRTIAEHLHKPTTRHLRAENTLGNAICFFALCIIGECTNIGFGSIWIIPFGFHKLCYSSV